MDVSASVSPPTGVAFDAVVGVAPGEMCDEELRCLLIEADRVRARLDAAVATLTAAFDGRGVWAADGARGAVPWLAARTHTSATGWRHELRLARVVADMPLVEAAAREGRLSRDKVKALVWARQPGLEDAFAWCEEQLVREVEVPTVAGAWRYVRRWVISMRELLELNEPDGKEPKDGEGRSKVTLAPGLEGRWFGSIDLDAEDGEVVANAVEQQIQDMWDQQVFQADDGLSPPERRAVAFVELLKRGTRGGEEDGTARPLMLGIVNLGDLVRHQWRQFRTGDESSADGDEPGRNTGGLFDVWGDHLPPADVLPLAELSMSGPVDPETLVRLACEGDVLPIVVGEDGAPLAMGRRIRLANRQQRRAVQVRDGHCAFAGCSVPARNCIVHHLVPWEDGGPTDLGNLCLLCRFHHRRVHEGGFRIGWDAGVLVTYRPDGTPITDFRPDRLGLRHRHRPPPLEGPSGEEPPPDRHRLKVEAPDPESLYLHRCARARVEALMAEATARRRAATGPAARARQHPARL